VNRGVSYLQISEDGFFEKSGEAQATLLMTKHDYLPMA
jgi:hypothetical protein